MNYLVIPDVHNHYESAERLIAALPHHQPVFLGDYFDDFDDTPAIARGTATWLRHSLNLGRLHLLGNHDLPYYCQSQYTACPGWTKEKAIEVNKVMTRYDWGGTRLIHVILEPECRPLVLSHAGITLANLYGIPNFRDVARGGRLDFLRDNSVGDHLQEVTKNADACLEALWRHGNHHWLNQGSRMGRRDAAGPFWVDRLDFNPISGIDQVMGRTHVKSPQRCFTPESNNWFIDGGGTLAATVEGGVITPIHATGERLGRPYE